LPPGAKTVDSPEQSSVEKRIALASVALVVVFAELGETRATS
jgi:hypothetical protein